MSVVVDFDGLSKQYTEKIQRWLPYYQAQLEGVILALPEGFHPERILDLGCGDGNLSFLLLQRFPDVRLTLLDASEEMLAHCRVRFAGQAVDAFVQAMFQEADFPEDSFDLVTAAFSIHHLQAPEKREFFGKVFRWLRPEGRLSMADLYIHRRDEPEYSRMMIEWERGARARGTTDDEWNWIIEHRDQYDRTDNFGDQLRWLREAGFVPKVSWQKDYWGCLLARKPGK